MRMAKRFYKVADKFADDVIAGKREVRGEIIASGEEIILACKRWKADLERDDLELRTQEPDTVINLMQGLVHAQGEDLEGNPLLGTPFILQDWQVFVVYNLLGWYYKGTNERRYKEAFICVGRKNGKTSFIAGLAWAVSILQRRSGSKCYVVASALKQTLESFNFLKFNIKHRGMDKDFSIKDNSFDHSIEHIFVDKTGKSVGSMKIIAMPTNPDAQDSFNCNFAIADEVASYKRPSQYNRFFEAQSAYTNKMMIGITTAGDNMNSFGYRRMEYAVKVVNGTVTDDSLFSFVARADQGEKGEVDFTNPIQHQKANLSYGVTKRPDDLKRRALQALNDPQQRKDFLSRELNIYTSAMKAWFDVEEFRASDRQYAWKLEELAKLPIEWFGGADLSRMYDLTASALFGTYEGVDIIITHGFFPITQAQAKSEEDNIPLYGWADDGWLTLCNHPTVNISDIVNWFKRMRSLGFKIKEIGHDRKFAGEEYFPEMKRAGFRVVDQPQYYWIKSQGFRHIEKSAKDGRLYYLHSEAFEYCVSNVKAIEKTDDQVQYEKIEPTQRIDLFDASVFACVRQAESITRRAKAKSWFGEDRKKGADKS